MENNTELQTYANYGIGGAYALLELVALVSKSTPACRPPLLLVIIAVGLTVCFVQVQLIRIQLRVPEYGWTTQKVFHLLNCVVCFLRGGVFFFLPQMDSLHPAIVKIVLMDLPGEGCACVRTRVCAPLRSTASSLPGTIACQALVGLGWGELSCLRLAPAQVSSSSPRTLCWYSSGLRFTTKHATCPLAPCGPCSWHSTWWST